MKNYISTLKRAAMLTALAASASTGAFAQVADEEFEQRFRFGIKGGLNLTSLYKRSSGVSDDGIKPGFHAGVFLRTPLASVFSFQPEALYTTFGSKLNYNQAIVGRNSATFNLNYIQVPLMIRVNPLETFNVHFGPYASYLLNANISKEQIDPTGGAAGDGSKLNTDAFETIDYGAAAGVEINIKYVDIGVRYNLGLRQVGKSDAAKRLTGNGRNQGFNIYAAFVF